MSDEPLTKGAILEFIALIRDEDQPYASVRVPAERFLSLCNLALRGLAKEPLEWPETDAELTAAHIEEACETIMRGNTHRNDVITSLSTLRRLALRGLEAERVREEALEEAALALDAEASVWMARVTDLLRRKLDEVADEADNNAIITKRAAEIIRALKKGHSDASDATHGARVRKTTGDYTFEGVIVAWFYKRDGQTVRYVVEDDRGTCHIADRKQLEVISDAS